MKLKLVVVGLVWAGVGLGSAPAWGCLNDRSTITAENDFKSSYLKKKGEEVSPARVSVGGWVAIGVGVAFTGFAGILTMRGKRRD